MSIDSLASRARALRGARTASDTESRLPRFEELYTSHQAYVRKTLFWLVPREAVDDLVQEVFLKIWRNLGAFREESAPRTWIYRITVNTAFDFLRARKEPAHEDLETHPDLAAPAAESDPALQRLIRQGLETLPIKQRLVFVLYYKQELSVEEIAETLKVPKGTVKSRLFHAREAFGDFLSRNGVKV